MPTGLQDPDVLKMRSELVNPAAFAQMPAEPANPANLARSLTGGELRPVIRSGVPASTTANPQSAVVMSSELKPLVPNEFQKFVFSRLV